MKIDARNKDVAFEVNLIAHRNFIKSVIRTYCNRACTDWIEDLVQDVCIKALMNRSSFDVNKGRFSTWLYTLAKNTKLDFQAKSAVRLTTLGLPESTTQTVMNDFDQLDLKENIARALAKLGAVESELILNRDYMGYSGREVAKKMAIPENQLPVYLHRARLKMRKLLST